MKHRITWLITIASILVGCISLAGIIILKKFETEDILKDIADALFTVALSIIVINLIIEKSFEREKKKEEAIGKEKEEREWQFIHLYLSESIMRVAIAALEILPPIYRMYKEADLKEPADHLDRFMISTHFEDFNEARMNYTLYVTRFIHRFRKDQVKEYRAFERQLYQIKRPSPILLGDLSKNKNNEFAVIARRGAIRDYFYDGGAIVRLAHYYIQEKFSAGLLSKIGDKVNNRAPSELDLKSSPSIGMLGLEDSTGYFEEHSAFGFDLSNTIAHLLLCTQYEEMYSKEF